MSLNKAQLRSIGSNLGFDNVNKLNKEQLIIRLSTHPYKSIVAALKN